MKKLQYILLALAFVLAGCNNKDSIWNVMDDMDSRIATLEVLCQEMNTNISALETLIKAQNNGDYITNITEIRNGSTIVGYTITFKNHEPVTIYNGTNGKDGHDGTDGYKPTVGAKQDTDGIYYWTVDGDWLTDANGNKIPVTGEKGDKGDKGDPGDKGQDGQDGTNGVNGNTPQLKIENNYWYISYDGGTSWTQLGKATGEDGKDGTNGTNGSDGTKGEKGEKGEKGDKGDAGDTMFQSVTQDTNYVYFTLADGTLIKIAKNGSGGTSSQFKFEVTYDANGGEGIMSKDVFDYGVAKELSSCKYTKDGYNFANWNTSKDGSGVAYEGGQSIIIDRDMVLYAQWIEGSHKLCGRFSVSDSTQVVFSTGILQYTDYNKKYYFAEHQYDVASMSSFIYDFFCWGTGADPTSRTPSSSFVDWGVNTINNDVPNTWRTLSDKEWLYLLVTRPNADKLFALGSVNNTNGLILLPDNWVSPNLITLICSTDREMTKTSNGYKDQRIYNHSDHFEDNTFNTLQWQIIEDAGGVFLPACGCYDSSRLINDNACGYYLLAESTSSLEIKSGEVAVSSGAGGYKYTVRLVHDVK